MNDLKKIKVIRFYHCRGRLGVVYLIRGVGRAATMLSASSLGLGRISRHVVDRLMTYKRHHERAAELIAESLGEGFAAETPEETTAAILAQRGLTAAGVQPGAGRVWRCVTADDPSIYGSGYLGKEGTMQWMPA